MKYFQTVFIIVYFVFTIVVLNIQNATIGSLTKQVSDLTDIVEGVVEIVGG